MNRNLILLLCTLVLAFFADGHGVRTKEGNHKVDVKHEKEHIQHHLEGVSEKKVEDMTEEELEFHYFKLHDYNGDDKLDGTEIFKAVYHEDHPTEDSANKFDIKPVVEEVDSFLEDIDLNKDGYVSYMEYKWIHLRN